MKPLLLFPALFILLQGCNPGPPTTPDRRREYDSVAIAKLTERVELIEKETRTSEYYAKLNHDEMNAALIWKFRQIDSSLYLKRESKLGRFLGTAWKYSH